MIRRADLQVSWFLPLLREWEQPRWCEGPRCAEGLLPAGDGASSPGMMTGPGCTGHGRKDGLNGMEAKAALREKQTRK